MYLCTCVPLYQCTSVVIFTLAKPTRSNAKIYMFFFFSWGNFSLLVHRRYILEDDRSEGCYLLAPGSLFFFLSFFCFFFVVYVSKVLARRNTKVGKIPN